MVEQPLRQGRSGSYSGEAKRAHGEAEAERLLARGLAAGELEERHLAEVRKGSWEKEVLAWWLCQHTTARRRWVSERLAIALFWVAPDPSNVFTNSLVSRRTSQTFASQLRRPACSAGRGVTDRYWLTSMVMPMV